MKDYLIALAGAAIVIAIVGILAPEGEKGGLSKHLKLFTALLLALTLISPVVALIDGVRGALTGEIAFPWEKHEETVEPEELQNVLDGASADYVTDMLTQSVETQFKIPQGEVRCTIEWDPAGEDWKPVRATVILSGASIWRDPAELEDFVTSLLGCECVSAIE